MIPINQTHAGSVKIFTTGSWKTCTSHITKRCAIFSDSIEDYLEVSAPPVDEITLLFLGHEWSGEVRLDHFDQHNNYDLFDSDSVGVIKKIKLPLKRAADGAISSIKISCSGTSNSQAKAHQVWLLGFELQGKFIAIERGEPLTDKTRLIHGQWGNFLTLRSDIGVAEALAEFGIWAKNDIDLFTKHIPLTGTVLDVGANFGHHSVVFSKLVGPSGRVLAFEPQRVMFALLCANMALNDAYNICPINVALGQTRETLRLYPISYDAPTNFGSLGVNNSTPAEKTHGKGEIISVLTLDNYLSNMEEPLTKLDFIKIDVQSFEFFVLTGSLSTLARFKPTIFLEIAPLWMKKAGYDYKEIYTLLFSLGYGVSHSNRFTDQINSIPEWDGLEDIEWDILAIHSEKNQLD